MVSEGSAYDFYLKRPKHAIFEFHQKFQVYYQFRDLTNFCLLNDYEASVLRLEPLAVESVGTRFWYLRLYEEWKSECRPREKW
ncbi:hypothetical protein BpHYR1_020935 [Brachionus plicatilis]|uniref:Uncharacterized protein n=1 Tax=Brachionus plicatilis TaxID=10195 RepID=A0A3M7RQL6_BRAPC|nr:hypothetical protein BpHYR1_020935 [Brachionus plicatilis]